MSHHRNHAFTLIELLVVISIIALLIAILLPTLNEARRSGLVTQCSARLKSYALGLTIYATEDVNGHYPIADIAAWGGAHVVWSPQGAYVGVAPRKEPWLNMYTEMICGGNRSMLWCPVWISNVSDDQLSTNPQDPNWPLLWWAPDVDNYLALYYRFSNMKGPSSMWANSGNSQTDEAPLRPGASNDAILADMCNNNGPLGEPDQYFQDAHMQDTSVGSSQVMALRRENNVAYSDGHVETHGGGIIGADGFFTWGEGHYVLHGGAPWRLQY